MDKLQVTLGEIFEALLAHFGPRNWWPAETPLEVVVGAILTQNVSWKNVEKCIANLNEKELLELSALVAVPEAELAELIRPSRYFNQKAGRLKAFAQMVAGEFGGSLDELFALDTFRLRKKLLDLKGIGKETADSIILYAAQKPIFVVDAYTRRIFSRQGFFATDASYDQMQTFFTEHVPEDLYVYQEFHALIDGLGNRVCLANNPGCAQCPLSYRCLSWGEDSGE